MKHDLIDKRLSAPLTRRELLARTGAGAIVLGGVGFAPSAASGAPKTALDVLESLLDLEAWPQSGRMRLSIPPVYRDGSSVPLSVEVDSPMTEADYVKAVHVAAPGNPFPEVADFHFTPLSGKAKASTRIRLEAGDQTVVATAELSDGTVLTARSSVRVTIGGCSS